MSPKKKKSRKRKNPRKMKPSKKSVIKSQPRTGIQILCYRKSIKRRKVNQSKMVMFKKIKLSHLPKVELIIITPNRL